MAMEGIKNALSKAKTTIKVNSPEILKVAGVVTFVGTVALACRATLKVKDIIDEHNDDMDQIESALENEEVEYTEEDAKSDRVKRYAMTVGKVIKEVTPAVILATVSIACQFKSNQILRKENAQLKKEIAAVAAAHGLATRALDAYRANVREQLGEEVDYAMMHGLKAKEIEEVIVDEKTGKTKTVKKQVAVADGKAYSYVRYLTKSNENWKGGVEDYIEMFLRGQQNWANDLLRSRKNTAYPYVTWNEVLDMLGFEPCAAGMIVGWDANSTIGDRFIQFDAKWVKIPNEYGEYEDALAIDFNVQGLICPEVRSA